PVPSQDARGGIDDVALGDAAEAELESGRDAHAAPLAIELDPAVVDAGAARLDLLSRGDFRDGVLRRPELQEVAQLLERAVERALGDAAGPERTIEHAEELGSDGDPAPGALVDAAHLAVRAPLAEDRLEPCHFGDGCAECGA